MFSIRVAQPAVCVAVIMPTISGLSPVAGPTRLTGCASVTDSA
ncbi:MAG: hypothetical protein BWX70_03525 [Verrucomicrobia bacterium ADurb.Bin070]|nr:MAG: hypothetical protein BWX70_03525 [Verrucomicrobia bacterium ADurb.Bin070]